MPNARCLWTLPAGVRSAVTAEASRRDMTASEVVADFFVERFPGYVADAIRRTIAANLHSPEPREIDPEPKPRKIALVHAEPEDAEVG
jgi:hypothetical protein